MRSLRDMQCGKSAVVVRLAGEGALKRRIMDMGITKGTNITVRKVALSETRSKSLSEDMNLPSAKRMPKI